MRRHTRRAPPTCKSSWRAGRIALTPFSPAVLTGWVRWLDSTVGPPIDVMTLISAVAQSGPTEYVGRVHLPGVEVYIEITASSDPALYDLSLTMIRPGIGYGENWINLPRPVLPCGLDTGELSKVYTPGIRQMACRLSL